MTTTPALDGTIVRCHLTTPTWSTYEQFVVWATLADGATLMQQMVPESSERPHQDLLPSGRLVCGHIVKAQMRLPGGIVLRGFIPDGRYKARDPQTNSLDILTRQALGHWERGEVLGFRRDEGDSWEDRAAAAQRDMLAQLQDAEEARATVFRQIKGSGVPVKRIAEEAGLSRPQMYSILG